LPEVSSMVYFKQAHGTPTELAN